MSQKTAKRIRRLEARMDAQERRVDAWDAAVTAVHKQELLDTTAQRNAERRRARQAERTAATWKTLTYAALAVAIVIEVIAVLAVRAKAVPVGVDTTPESVASVEIPPDTKAIQTVQEEPENELIEAALLAQAHMIEDCTVTWYTADTCNKNPGDPGYGITASGLPVVEHLTCAVDPEVIPLYADVFVQYANGTIEQLWATDTGVKGNHIDIYTPDYDYAIQCGRQTLAVWWVEPE